MPVRGFFRQPDNCIITALNGYDFEIPGLSLNKYDYFLVMCSGAHFHGAEND